MHPFSKLMELLYCELQDYLDRNQIFNILNIAILLAFLYPLQKQTKTRITDAHSFYLTLFKIPSKESFLIDSLFQLTQIDCNECSTIPEDSFKTLQNAIYKCFSSFIWQTIEVQAEDIVINPKIFEIIYEEEYSDQPGLINTPRKVSDFIVFLSLTKYIQKKTGLAIYTLQSIQNLSELDKDTLLTCIKSIKIIDLSVGCGAFYFSALKYILDLTKELNTKKPLSIEDYFFILDFNLYGIDLNPQSLIQLKLQLFIVLFYELNDKKVLLEGITYLTNIIQGNSLLYSINELQISAYGYDINHNNKPNLDNEFDIIIGNPPYSSYGTISVDDKIALKNAFSSIYTGLNDVYYFFIVKCLEIGNYNSFTTLIVPRYFLEARYANKLLKHLFQNNHVEIVIDFRNYKIFSNATINCAIINVAKKHEEKNETKFFILQDETITLSSLMSHLKSILYSDDFSKSDLFKQFTLTNTEIDQNDYSLNSIETIRLIDSIKKNSMPLGEYCLCGTGYHTGSDEVFSKNITKVHGEFYGKHNESLYPLESGLIKEIVKTSDLFPFVIKNKSKYVLLMHHDINISSYPQTLAYLSLCKEKLEQRYEYKKGLAKWFEVSQIRNNQIFLSQKKIILPYRAVLPRFSIDDTQKYTSIDCTSIALKESSNISLDYLVAVLNSELITFFLLNTAKKIDANKIELYPKIISTIPIKLPDQNSNLYTQVIQLSKEMQTKLKNFKFETELKRDIFNNGIKLAKSSNKEFLEIQSLQNKLDTIIYEIYDCIQLKNKIILELQNFHGNTNRSKY